MRIRVSFLSKRRSDRKAEIKMITVLRCQTVIICKYQPKRNPKRRNKYPDFQTCRCVQIVKAEILISGISIPRIEEQDRIQWPTHRHDVLQVEDNRFFSPDILAGDSPWADRINLVSSERSLTTKVEPLPEWNSRILQRVHILKLQMHAYGLPHEGRYEPRQFESRFDQIDIPTQKRTGEFKSYEIERSP